MIKISNIRNGFTLIELLVVISIVGILSVISIASFVDYSRKEALNAATGEVTTLLQSAKARAQSQVKPTVGACVQNPLEGYKVTVIDQQQYKLEAICGSSYVIQTKKLPTGITFAQPTSFYFRAITGGVESGTIVISSPYGMSKTIELQSSGTIRLQ